MNKERTKIIATNIRKYVKEAGITQKELAKAIDISPSTLSDYLNLRSNPSHGVIQRIADYFGVAKSDIDTTYKEDTEQNKLLDIYNQLDAPRQDYVYSVAQDQLNEQNNLIHEDSAQYIITGRQTAAGSAIYVDDAEARINVLDASSSPVPRGADESVTVVGDSMEPLIKDGSQVYVRHQPQVENGEIALINIIDEGVTCKKFYADGDGFFTLKSINPDYDDMHFRGDQIRVIGKVLLKNS